MNSTWSLFQIVVMVIFSMILFLHKVQCNIGLIPFAYTLRLDSESQGTEVTLTSSKYLSFYCFDFEYTTHNNFVRTIQCFILVIICYRVQPLMIPQPEEIISVKLSKP